MMTHLFLELKLDISWSQGRRLRISPCTLLVQLIDFSHSVGLFCFLGCNGIYTKLILLFKDGVCERLVSINRVSVMLV